MMAVATKVKRPPPKVNPERKLNCLVVVGSKGLARLLEEQLGILGFATEPHDIASALYHCSESHRFDLAIIDYQIGCGSEALLSMDLVNMLLSTGRWDTPIVLSSGDARPANAPEAIREEDFSGCGWLQVPHGLGDLIQAIITALSWVE